MDFLEDLNRVKGNQAKKSGTPLILAMRRAKPGSLDEFYEQRAEELGVSDDDHLREFVAKIKAELGKPDFHFSPIEFNNEDVEENEESLP